MINKISLLLSGAICRMEQKRKKTKGKRSLPAGKRELKVLFLKGTPHPFEVSHGTADFLSCSPLSEVVGIWTNTLFVFFH